MKIKDIHFKAIIAFISIFSLLAWSLGIEKVFAADLTSLSDLMTRTKKSIASSHDISFDLDGGTTFDATETVVVDFDEDGGGFAVDAASSIIADFDFDDGAERVIFAVDVGVPVCGASVGINDIAVGIVEVTGVVTFEACASFASSGLGATVNIEYGTAATDNGSGTNRVTNPGTAQNYLLIITAAGDTGKIAVDIEDEDQISVTASVDPSITFTVVTTAFAFGTLSTTVPVKKGPNAITVSTNASNGWTIYIYDVGNGIGSPGLYNSVAPYLIPSVQADLDVVDGGYGAQCTEGSGNFCDPSYEYLVNVVGGLLTTSDVFATYGSKPAGTDTLSISAVAEAPSAADAGSYTDTITVISTAIF
ncbi:MAG: hypothetical protein ABH837_00815 [bacterium]